MNPIWGKTPLLLIRRYTKVFAAVAFSAVLLGLASTSGTLFLSSSGSAALASNIENQAPLFLGFRIGFFDSFAEPEAREALAGARGELDATIGTKDHIGEPVTTLLGPNRDASSAGGDVTQVRLISRSEAEDHVEILEGNASRALIADTAAEEAGVGVGDTLTVEGTNIEISGIYRSLATSPFDPYWTNLGRLIFPDPTGATPPTFLLMEQDTFFEVAEPIGLRGNFFWEWPLQGRLTLEAARELASYMRLLERGVNDNEAVTGAAEQAVVDRFSESGQVINTFPAEVADAESTVTALEGPVLILALAGRIVALAVMAAAGAYLVVARKNEVQLLTARGMTPIQQGLRASFETVLPAVLGIAAGSLLGSLLIRAVGPSDLVSSKDVTAAYMQSVYTAVAGLIVLGASATVVVKLAAAPAGLRKTRAWNRLPWEVPVLILAGAAFYEITTRSSVVIEGEDGDRIDVFVLIFPILFLIGAAGLVARAVPPLFAKARTITPDRSSAGYLASRRLAAAPGSISALFIAAVLAVGILIYAHSLAQTITASTEAKAGVFVGSDVQLLVYATTEIPADFAYPATRVRKIPHLRMTNGTDFTMMGVDRSTFEEGAFWDSSFADRSLADLLDDLEPSGDTLPVIVVDGDTSVERSPAIDLSTDQPLEPIAFVKSFPGMAVGQPLVVADIEGMAELFSGVNSTATANSETHLWVKGDANEVQAAAAEAGISVGTVRTAAGVLERPTLSSVTWAFELLRALGFAAGTIAFVAVLLYMQARQRATVISYAMARRMGLTKRQHSGALAIEIAAILSIAVIAGTILAVSVAKLLYGHLDLLPNIPPAPILQIPSLVIVGLFGCGILAALIGALLVQRGADRAKVAEVLRLAE